MGTPDLAMADLIAAAPSLGAGTVRKEPLNCDELSVKTFLEDYMHAEVLL